MDRALIVLHRIPRGITSSRRMSFRRIGRAGLLGAALVLATSGCSDSVSDHTSKTETSPRKPNLIVITLDTTRADALGTWGQSRPTSPEIDRMARSGMVFTQALASAPITLPSHSSIFSGKHPYAHGVRSNAGYVLSDRHVTLAEVMQSRGYVTAAEVATDVLRRATQIDQGFGSYRGPGSPGVELKRVRVKGSQRIVTRPIRTGADISAKGIEFMRANRNRKFFLWLHYFDAHQPYVIPERYRRKFPDSPYHAAVALEDEFVGKVIREIEDLGLRENTLVILTADHGEGLGEHGEDTHSYFVYDSTMHVPLIFWGLPKIPEGRVHTGVVRTVDITPTVLDLLGARPLADIQGVSLAPIITGRTRGPSLLGYGESFESASFFGLSPIRFVREGRWKYIHKVNPELYDIETDPKELTNRISERPEVANRLRARLEDLLRDAPARPADSTTAIDPQIQIQLQALGYVSDSVIPPDFDEVESLEVEGADPASKIDTLRRVTRTLSNLDAGLYDEAVEELLPLAAENPDSAFVLSRLAEAQAARGDTSEAVETYQRVLALDPCEERSLTEMNRLLKLIGRYEALVTTLRRGAEACPNFAGNLNNYAWALATLPQADLRDGERAVAVARRALEILGERSPGFLDTLAVALAEADRFDEAISIQSEALGIARKSGGPKALIDELETHLMSFRAGRPIRSPAAEASD